MKTPKHLEMLSVASNKKGVREVGDSISVMPPGVRSQEMALYITLEQIM